MALFKLFTGTVVDVDINLVTEFRYRGYHKPTNKWSNWYPSNGESQYNFNMGDAAWLSQTGNVNTGDSVLIVIETLETLPINRSFAMIEMVLTGNDTYVQDIQLRPCFQPNVKSLWTLISTAYTGITITDSNNTSRIIYVGSIGDNIRADEYFNDEHAYTYANKIHKHVLSYYNQAIFSDRLGILTSLFDWDTGLYVTDEEHVFTSTTAKNTSGYIPIKVKVTNKSEQTVIDTLYLQIRNNAPVIDLTWSPDRPSIKDNFTVHSKITDIDNSMISVTYFMDDTTIASNKLKDYSLEYSLGINYVGYHTYKATVKWSDGFNTLTFDYAELIYMTNLPPTFTLALDSTYKEATRIKLIDLADPDGDTSKLRVKWSLDMLVPGTNNYIAFNTTVYPSAPNDTYIDYSLTLAVGYKVTAYVIDENGAENTGSLEFAIAAVKDDTNKIRLEWE